MERIALQLQKRLVNLNGGDIVSILSVIVLISTVLFSFLHAVWNPYWTDGDELHYMLMTQSIILDGDLNMGNNYVQQDYLEHHGTPIEGTHTVRSPVDGSLRSWHEPGVSILMVPGYMLGGMTGGRVFLWLINTISIMTLYYIVAREIFEVDFATTCYSLAIIVISFPILVYSQYGYADMITGVLWLLISVLGYFIFVNYRDTSKIAVYSIAASSIAGIGIFFHQKMFIAYALTLLSIAAVLLVKYYKMDILKCLRDSNVYRLGIILLTPFLLFVAAKSILMYRWFGSFSPNIAYDLAVVEFGLELEADIINNFLGILFDSGKGIFIFTPLLLVVASYLLWLFMNKVYVSLIFIVPPLLYVLIQTLFPVWFSWGPPNRYFIIPLLLFLSAVPVLIDKLFKTTLGQIVLCVTFAVSAFISFSVFFLLNGGYPSYFAYNKVYELYADFVPFLPDTMPLYIDLFNEVNLWQYTKAVIVLLFIILLNVYLGGFYPRIWNKIKPAESMNT